MATTKIRSSSIEDGQVSNADLSATIAVTGGQIADNAVTLAKMAGGIDGNLITYDASGDPAYVATGSATNVLTSNGTGAAPTFQAPAAGGIAASEMKGYRERPMFTRDSTTTMKLNGAFVYQHAGTTTQILSGADVTFTRSDTSGTAQFNYLYIDDSAVVTAGNTTITASELISSPTVPTLSTTKGGFYNGNDRCIYAFKQDASNDIYREGRISQLGNPGTIRTDYTSQFVNISGSSYGVGWHSYTLSADYLPRPCGPSGLAVGAYVELGGSHSTMYVGPDSQDWDMFIVGNPWFVNAPVNSSGQINLRSDYAHSSYTHIFYTRGWIMSPLL
jgi:hypothetical protein